MTLNALAISSESETSLVLDRATLEESLARKLSLKERLAVKLLNKCLKKQSEYKQAGVSKEGRRYGGSSKSLAIIGFVLGLVSILGVFGFPYTVIVAVPAIVIGIIALSKARNSPGQYSGKGLAIAGIVLGALAIGMFIGLIIAIALLYN
jgi:hypothetical protein